MSGLLRMDEVELLEVSVKLLNALNGMIEHAKEMNEYSDLGGQLDHRYEAAVAAVARAEGRE